MNMKNQLTVNIVDLPDEILLHILKKLDNFDVLYSLVGVNEKLDRLACDISFTRLVDLMTIESNRMNASGSNAILVRFCMEILPRIHDKVESLTLQACFLTRVLYTINYLHLRKVVIINLELNMAYHIFNEKSPFIHFYKQQISDLVLTISDETLDDGNVELLTDIYNRFFGLFTNLKYLDLDVDDTYSFFRPLLTDLSSTTCCSSSIVHLRIRMQNIDDCLYLLDGRLSQLHTLIITLDYIHDPVQIRRRSSKIIRHSLKIMNNLINPLRLKYFSLYVYHTTTEFDSLVLPLLRRMTHLEKLTLSLRVGQKNSFIDDTYLDNYILSQMPYLHTFHFDIVTDYVRINPQQPQPTPDDIRRTFMERGYPVDCYIDHPCSTYGRCHVYSLPFHMERICHIPHSFPGGMFINVRILHMKDHDHPFEHKFFAQISRSFPLLSRLILANTKEQKEKDEEKSSIIDFSHLVELAYHAVHIDYVEQFLSDSNTRLPCLNKIRISYRDLVSVTKNFTRSTTRMNCAKLKHIIFGRKMSMVYSKDYYLYFPLLL